MQTILIHQPASVGTFFGFTLDEIALKGPILAWRPERGVVVVWEDYEDFALYTLWRGYAGTEDEDSPIYAFADTTPAKGITLAEMSSAATDWLDNWLDGL
ncbi:hypothetical protein dsx2_1992 [Desulfovibrio sp. X2]|uniref:hypothetical protein n=1 Tax=Desulfovibrio sp. X2 TaxID=941449 RepID=UPI0003587927|nr:hypothetical protein [Desulfovibrio sp. X2]EPR43953.1 hypothetical protein dsx2_1992 [Desulfovibrio sp. X2]